MNEQVKKWIDENKDGIAAFGITTVLIATSVMFGYKLGVKRTKLHNLKVFNTFMPDVISESGRLGFVNTMELIDNTVPEAVDMVVEHFGGSTSSVTKAVAHRFFTDPDVKETMEFLKEAFVK